MNSSHGYLILSAIALSISAPSIGFAQTSLTSWENLRQLTPGQKIEVVQKNRKLTGSFVSVTDDSIALKAPDGDKTVPRSDVLRVSRHGGKRGRNILIGAAIGAGAGVAVGAAAGGCKTNSFGPCVGRGAVAGVVGALGAVVGAVVGAVIPGNTVIYRN